MESATHTASLLDLAKPHLVDRTTSRKTAPGELCVALRDQGRYALLPQSAEAILPLLDGEHRLADIIAQRWSQGDRITHDGLFAILQDLWESGLLRPLDPDVERFLSSQKKARGRSFWHRLLSFRLLLPAVWAPKADSREPQGRTWLVPVLLLVVGLSGAIWIPGGPRPSAPLGQFLGTDPVAALLGILAGISQALSVRSLVQAFWVRASGGRIAGAGIQFSLLIPHLTFGLEDIAFLPASTRTRIFGQSLAAVALLMSLLLWGSTLLLRPLLFFPGVGAGLVLLAQLCPLLDLDLSRMLAGTSGIRDLAARSSRFLLRRLVSGLFHKGAPAREEREVLRHATAGVLYLLATAFLLFNLALECTDVFLWVLGGGEASVLEITLATATVFYVWAGLLGILGTVVAAVLMALAQITRPALRQSLPSRVASGASLPMEELTGELLAIPPFSAFPEDLVKGLLERGRLETYRSGAFVVRQGEPGSSCYVVRSGKLSVLVRDAFGEEVEVSSLEPGTLFGEVALLEAGIRTASIRAATAAEVLRLEGESFLDLVKKGGFSSDDVESRIRIHGDLKGHPIFRWIQPVRLKRLLTSLDLCRFEKGSVILKEGDEGDQMYLIHRGHCQVSREGAQETVRLGPGDVFGEMAVLDRTRRSATVTAVDDMLVACIPGQIAREVLSQEFSAGLVMGKEMARRKLSAVSSSQGRS